MNGKCNQAMSFHLFAAMNYLLTVSERIEGKAKVYNKRIIADLA